MKDFRRETFNIMCEGVLLAYSKEQEKVFEILAGRPLSSVSEKDMRNYKKNAKLWEILTNVRNEELPLKENGTVDMTNYKKIDIEKHINKQIDNIMEATFWMKLNDYIGAPVFNVREMLIANKE